MLLHDYIQQTVKSMIDALINFDKRAYRAQREPIILRLFVMAKDGDIYITEDYALSTFKCRITITPSNGYTIEFLAKN